MKRFNVIKKRIAETVMTLCKTPLYFPVLQIPIIKVKIGRRANGWISMQYDQMIQRERTRAGTTTIGFENPKGDFIYR